MRVDYHIGQEMVLTHRCGDCGSGLLMPVCGDHYELRCRKDPAHVTFTPKNWRNRHLYDTNLKRTVEVDIMTQQPVTELAQRELPNTVEGMIKRGELARWPQDMATAHKQAMAQVALAYGLDFLNDELIPYQGKPYITIKGRRRLDEEAGNRFTSIKWRKLTDEEHLWYTGADAIEEGDLNGFAVGILPDGSVFEGFGKVTKKERAEQAKNGGGPRSPVVANNPIEMFWNRSERRLREIAFGPVRRPTAVEAITVLEEGDEVHIVDGEVINQEVTAPPKEPPKNPDRPNGLPEADTVEDIEALTRDLFEHTP